MNKYTHETLNWLVNIYETSNHSITKLKCIKSIGYIKHRDAKKWLMSTYEESDHSATKLACIKAIGKREKEVNRATD